MRILTLVLAVCLVLGMVGYGAACEDPFAPECLYIKNLPDTDWVPRVELAVSEEAIPAEIAFRAWYTSMYEE